MTEEEEEEGLHPGPRLDLAAADAVPLHQGEPAHLEVRAEPVRLQFPLEPVPQEDDLDKLKKSHADEDEDEDDL